MIFSWIPIPRAGSDRPPPPALAAAEAGGDTSVRDATTAAPADLPPFNGTIPFFPFGAPAKRPPLVPLRDSNGRKRNIVFCWELGGGLGHMMQMLLLARDLASHGHRVFVALRDAGAAAVRVFGRAGVSFLPVQVWDPKAIPHPRPLTFTQMLLNVGYGHYETLFDIACRWRNLLRLTCADLVVADHSPTALLASRGLPCRRALIGSGFCCPPEAEGDAPWGMLRQVPAAAAADALRADERRLLDNINRVLAGWAQPAIERPAQLYSEVDENFLTTFPELDPFPHRRGAGYWGPVLAGSAAGGLAPQWPEAPGRRIFAYLKRCPALVETLQALADSGHPTLVYVDGIVQETRQRFESPTLHLAPRPLDLGHVARECDLAVVNGGHGATAEMLLAGRPLLHVPRALEQRLTADAVKRMGAGEAPRSGKGGAVHRALIALLDDTGARYVNAARRFADRYAAFDRDKQRGAMLDRAEELLAGDTHPGNPTVAPNAA